MGYAVLQKTLDPPSPESLSRAFRALPSLARLDGPLMARDAFGILVRDLSRTDAERLQGALASEDIAAEAVDERELIPLSRGHKLPRADCLAEVLMVYDSMQRPRPVPWQHVVLLAMGTVCVPHFRRIETDRVIHAGTPDGGNVPVVVTDVSRREESVELPLLEIFTDVAPARWHVSPTEFNYAYLGERLQRGVSKNYALFVDDLCRNAPHALLNRGAEVFRAGPRGAFHYPNRHAFEEEIIWLLWKTKKAG